MKGTTRREELEDTKDLLEGRRESTLSTKITAHRAASMGQLQSPLQE
jgi:hypothetical protein